MCACLYMCHRCRYWGTKGYKVAHACQRVVNRSGTLTGVQASLPDLTVHVWRFSHSNHLVISLMSFLHILRVDIKVNVHETWGSFGWFGQSFGLFLWLVPQLVHLGSHRPTHWASSVPSGSGTITRQGNALYLFNHMYSRLYWVPCISVP